MQRRGQVRLNRWEVLDNGGGQWIGKRGTNISRSKISYLTDLFWQVVWISLADFFCQHCHSLLTRYQIAKGLARTTTSRMTRSVTAVGVPQSTAQHLRFLGKYVIRWKKLCPVQCFNRANAFTWPDIVQHTICRPLSHSRRQSLTTLLPPEQSRILP